MYLAYFSFSGLINYIGEREREREREREKELFFLLSFFWGGEELFLLFSFLLPVSSIIVEFSSSSNIHVYSCQEYSDIARASFSYKTSCTHAVFSHLGLFTPCNSESEGRTYIQEIENSSFGILFPSLKPGFQWFWM